MTAAMPTAMPSSVRKLRSRCAVMARQAKWMESTGRIIAMPSAWPATRPGRAVQPGGPATRRTGCRDQRRAQSGNRRPVRRVGRVYRIQLADDGRSRMAQRETEHGPGQRQHRRFGEEGRTDRPAGSAERLEQPDLRGALRPETSITFITRMPATARLIAAIPATASVSVPSSLSKVASTASCVMTVSVLLVLMPFLDDAGDLRFRQLDGFATRWPRRECGTGYCC